MKSISAINNKQHIEKFKGNFIDVEGGCTVIHTKSAQLISDFFLLGLYIYLASKPPEWKVNVKELMSHGKCGRDKIYKGLSDLCMTGLIERKELREKGRFIEFQYYLHLSPLPENKEMDSPLPDLPDTVKPFPENQHTYKEEKLPYKEKNIKKDENSLTSTPNPKKPPTREELQQYAYYKKNPPMKPKYEWIGDHV